MAFHPPMLYLGYVGFTIPFAFAMAALITGRFGEGWLADTRRTTLVAWGFLTVGIVLGAWWSYEVLGWGGYWGWDPVENASLLPWLTATAFIHSVIVQERRGMLRVWNLSLVIATFCLTILGTFLTRSGVVNSVHAFTQSSIGPWLLTFLGIVVVDRPRARRVAGRQAARARAASTPRSRARRRSSRTTCCSPALAFVVLLGTVFPLLAEALRGSQISVGEPYFDRMAAPIGLALLFLMAVAPALPWRATSGEVLRHRLLHPRVRRRRGDAAHAGVPHPAPSRPSSRSAWPRSRSSRSSARPSWRCAAGGNADHAGWARSRGRHVRGNPRRYGGFIVHIGRDLHRGRARRRRARSGPSRRSG